MLNSAALHLKQLLPIIGFNATHRYIALLFNKVGISGQQICRLRRVASGRRSSNIGRV
jgi:hypothetical protein